jgi:hypothetical protein
MRHITIAALAALLLLSGCPDAKLPKDPTKPPTPQVHSGEPAR